MSRSYTQPDQSESSPLLGNTSHSQTQHHDSRDDPDKPLVETSRWRHISQMAAAMLSFAVLGLSLSSIGVMVPYLQNEFTLDEVQVSLAFLIPPFGYVLTAQLNNFVHINFGQRGVAIIGPLCHIVSAVAICIQPSFEVYLCALAVAALGCGLVDGSWCSWAASMDNANTMCGLLHSSFATGAGLGPFLAATVLTDRHAPWYSWYYVLAFASVLESIALVLAFWPEDGKAYRAKHRASEEENNAGGLAGLRLCFASTTCWLCATYLLLYVGTESTVSDWAVTFMLRARGASPKLSAAATSGFWAAMAVGRLVLGPVTDKIGVKFANLIYLSSAMALSVLLTIVQHTVAASILLTFLGFFFGPMFASSLVLLNSKLPSQMHIPAVSFVASVGQIGAALLPFGLGAMIKAFGIFVFTYVVFVQLAAATLVWLIS